MIKLKARSELLTIHFLSSGLFKSMKQLTLAAKRNSVIAFIRFISEGKIIKQFLFCLDLSETTKGVDVFNLIDKNIKDKNLQWKNCVSLCTDGAPSMLGKNEEFAALVLKHNPKVMITHCMIHREALMTKVLPENLQRVMDQAVKVVNFIKAMLFAIASLQYYATQWIPTTKLYSSTLKCVGFQKEKCFKEYVT